MAESAEERAGAGGAALAAVQFAFTLGWTAYVVMLPGMLGKAGIALTWLPVILLLDQAIFVAMDIAFGVMADRMREVYQRLARLVLVLTSISAVAFLLLPMAAGVSPGLLLLVLLLWVVSASVVRAPTLILLAKRARAAQRPGLVIWYTAGMGLAMALSPFLGLWLKGADPQLPFAISALTLLGTVVVLLRVSAMGGGDEEADAPAPAPFTTCLPLFAALVVAGVGFQLHAFVNAAPLYQLHAPQETLPWLMPLLWTGFFAMLVGVGPLVKRFGAMPVAAAGLFVAALSSYLAADAGSLNALIAWQMLCGAGWAMAFAGLMEQVSSAGTRGAEGLFMGSFFAMTAVSAVLRITFAAYWLAEWQDSRFALPAMLLLAAAVIVAVDARKWAKIRTPKSP